MSLDALLTKHYLQAYSLLKSSESFYKPKDIEPIEPVVKMDLEMIEYPYRDIKYVSGRKSALDLQNYVLNSIHSMHFRLTTRYDELWRGEEPYALDLSTE